MALRAALWVHGLGAAVFLWLQPRGFAWGSRGFWEHQVLVPLYVLIAIGAAACPASRTRTRAAAAALPCAFWAVVGGTFALTGSTFSARALWAPVLAALALGTLILRSHRTAWPGLLAGGALGAAFLFSTWAPPASTRPVSLPYPEPVRGERADRTPPRIRLRVEGHEVVVTRGDATVRVDPGFRFQAASASGAWTIFDFRSLHLPPWTLDGDEGGGILLSANSDDLDCLGSAWVEKDGAHIRMATRLKRDVASHLSSVMTVRAAGNPRVQGVEWPAADPVSFIAFRGETIEFLRASRNEKGPFERLALLPAEDPRLEIGDWSVQVRGWAEQASREPSPTAGWGVSQAVIESWGGTVSWALASTGIGRGWHTVRTAAGTYVLEAVVR